MSVLSRRRPHYNCRDVALVKKQRWQGPKPVIIVGHSYGESVHYRRRNRRSRFRAVVDLSGLLGRDETSQTPKQFPEGRVCSNLEVVDGRICSSRARSISAETLRRRQSSFGRPRASPNLTCGGESGEPLGSRSRLYIVGKKTTDTVHLIGALFAKRMSATTYSSTQPTCRCSPTRTGARRHSCRANAAQRWVSSARRQGGERRRKMFRNGDIGRRRLHVMQEVKDGKMGPEPTQRLQMPKGIQNGPWRGRFVRGRTIITS